MTRAARRALALVALIGATVAGVAPASIATTTAAASSTAVVVIDTGVSVRAAVIHFDGTITGIQALVLAGGKPTTYGYSGQGAAVCSIDGVGNPADSSCLIGPNSEYWAYFQAHGGATTWSYARGCACAPTVQDGDVEGWRYENSSSPPRSPASFCSYVACPPPPTAPVTTTPVPTGPPTTVPVRAAAATTVPGTRPAVTTAPAASTTPSTSVPRAPRRGSDLRGAAASARRNGDGGDGAGSPVGVVIAAGALGATAGVAVWLRRRRGALR
jgi:hypothetical protein